MEGPSKVLDEVVGSDRDHSIYGSILVMPHLCSWEMENHRGLWQELSKLSAGTLRRLRKELDRTFGVSEDTRAADGSAPESKNEILQDLCQPRTWSVVVLYRGRDGQVRAALPAPPYYPHVSFDSDDEFDAKEADLTGPFPFRYLHRPSKLVDVSLLYLSPGVFVSASKLPTIDDAPAYSVPDRLTRSVRYAALLLDAHKVPEIAQRQVREYYDAFLSRFNEDQQNARRPAQVPLESGCDRSLSPRTSTDDTVLKVYTDSNDPLGLSHPEAGLTDPHFVLTDSVADADVVFSYHSLFAPTGDLRDALDARQALSSGVRQSPAMINQFPYEGAFVQKDHLARELWNQYGQERWPPWAIESYDLDVQFGAFVGAALHHKRERQRDSRENGDPVWIVKPARGTQSKGHLVTRSVAHICRLVDAGGTSRVAQRYIESPVCYQGRKVDCRCVVLMTDASPGRPTLYAHNRVFLRIANKRHDVSKPESLMDSETVLTATHLFHEAERSAPDAALPLLPVDTTTIRCLEETYGFSWKTDVLPKIHGMIRELFNGMTRAYPAMSVNPNSRAVYGVDVMFELSPDNKQVQPKLTEVTFCPANNATCAAYERDDGLYRTYLNDVFNCVFRNVISESLTPI
jgi:Tubulin-tyrosine ligase family